MQESKNVCANYLTKFSIDLNGTWYTVETCWCNDPHAYSFSCPFNIQGREPYLNDLKKKKKKKTVTLVCIQTFTDRFLSNLV